MAIRPFYKVYENNRWPMKTTIQASELMEVIYHTASSIFIAAEERSELNPP